MTDISFGVWLVGAFLIFCMTVDEFFSTDKFGRSVWVIAYLVWPLLAPLWAFKWYRSRLARPTIIITPDPDWEHPMTRVVCLHCRRPTEHWDSYKHRHYCKGTNGNGLSCHELVKYYGHHDSCRECIFEVV